MDKKDHADFQSKYNQSKNFNTEAKDEKLKVKGDGEVKIPKSDMLSDKEKEDIANAMDKMQERIEITPGGEQNDTNKQ